MRFTAGNAGGFRGRDRTQLKQHESSISDDWIEDRAGRVQLYVIIQMSAVIVRVTCKTLGTRSIKLGVYDGAKKDLSISVTKKLNLRRITLSNSEVKKSLREREKRKTMTSMQRKLTQKGKMSNNGTT